MLERLWGSALVWGHYFGEAVGVRLMRPVPMLAPLPVFLCHLNGLFIGRWGLWIWLTDHCTLFLGHLFRCLPWFPDSFLSLLSTLDLGFCLFFLNLPCLTDPMMGSPLDLSWDGHADQLFTLGKSTLPRSSSGGRLCLFLGAGSNQLICSGCVARQPVTHP